MRNDEGVLPYPTRPLVPGPGQWGKKPSEITRERFSSFRGPPPTLLVAIEETRRDRHRTESLGAGDEKKKKKKMTRKGSKWNIGGLTEIE